MTADEWEKRLVEKGSSGELCYQILKDWRGEQMSESEYDSTQDTVSHIHAVQLFLLRFAEELGKRAIRHDETKLWPEEKPTFDRVTPQLKKLTYGSAEYKTALEEMGEALKHHYKFGEHHPEHHHHGVEDMTLVDVVEMACDWLAASKRHKDGDIYQSIEHNRRRFMINTQLARIITNTMERVFFSI